MAVPGIVNALAKYPTPFVKNPEAAGSTSPYTPISLPGALASSGPGSVVSSSPTASVAAPTAAATPGAPIKVSALTDIKGPKTDALAAALIQDSNIKPRGALEALGALGEFWQGSRKQKQYEEAEIERANLPTKQIQEYVAAGGVIDAAHAKELIATGAEPLVKLGADFLSEQAKAQTAASLKPPEREKDEYGNIIERGADGTWQKVYSPESGIRAATPEEKAALPGVDWSVTGMGPDGKPIEFPRIPGAATELGKIYEDARNGVYPPEIAEVLANRALAGWKILTPEQIKAQVPGFEPKPGVIYQQGPDGKIDGVGAGGVSVQVGGETLTPGWKKIDETYAPEFIDWRLKGGSSEVEKQLAQLDEAFKRLSSETGLSGPIMTVIPKWAQYWAAPDAVEVRQAIQEVVQRNLRAILGSQFTAVEGENLIARAYDENLGQEENAKRVLRLITQIRDAAVAKESAAAFFEENGTLMGWKGQPLATSVADFNPDIPIIGEYQQGKDGKWYQFQGGLAGAPESWKETGPPPAPAPAPPGGL